jgi:NADPH:quinone reductase-like Zn-dependent oxidoreductase
MPSQPNLSSLPTPISTFITGINTFNATQISSPFAQEAAMIDESKNYEGRLAVHAFAEEALVGHHATVNVTHVTRKSDQIVLNVIMDGDFKKDYGITEPFPLFFYFKLDKKEQEILHLEISDLDPKDETMESVWASRGSLTDPISSIRAGRRRIPVAPEGWVKIKMLAASLNQHDIFTLKGIGIVPLKFPLIMGCEGVGELESGEKVMIYPVINKEGHHGDETLDPTRNVPSELVQGTLAEYTIMPKANVFPLPEGMDPEVGAVLGCAWLVAYRSLFTKSGLRAGQTMLVQGASGGVATALIQMGAAAGMRVWVAGRDDKKRGIASRLGAEKTFASGEMLPEQVDAVFDMAGAATWEHSVKSVKMGGTIVICGGHSGMDPPAGLMRIFVDQINVKGVYLGTLQELKDLVAFVKAKNIKPEIAEILPLGRAPEGLKKLASGETSGKIVITL